MLNTAPQGGRVEGERMMGREEVCPYFEPALLSAYRLQVRVYIASTWSLPKSKAISHTGPWLYIGILLGLCGKRLLQHGRQAVDVLWE